MNFNNWNKITIDIFKTNKNDKTHNKVTKTK